MPQVVALARRVETHDRAELRVVRAHGDLVRLAVLEAYDREGLVPGQPERLAALAGPVLQREHAHHEQVRAMDPLVALRDHRAHAEELRALGRPVA